MQQRVLGCLWAWTTPKERQRSHSRCCATEDAGLPLGLSNTERTAALPFEMLCNRGCRIASGPERHRRNGSAVIRDAVQQRVLGCLWAWKTWKERQRCHSRCCAAEGVGVPLGLTNTAGTAAPPFEMLCRGASGPGQHRRNGSAAIRAAVQQRVLGCLWA